MTYAEKRMLAVRLVNLLLILIWGAAAGFFIGGGMRELRSGQTFAGVFDLGIGVCIWLYSFFAYMLPTWPTRKQ
jgi:uncharacterized YccA/Bax inhibitor family protein